MTRIQLPLYITDSSRLTTYDTIEDASGTTILDCYHQSSTQFIINAINFHKELVRALEDISNYESSLRENGESIGKQFAVECNENHTRKRIANEMLQKIKDGGK